MRKIRVVKGLPLQLFIRIEDSDGNVINFNDGEWQAYAELRYQSITGSEPFVPTIETLPNGESLMLELSDVQTRLLDHKGAGYVLIIRAGKSDSTVNLRNLYHLWVIEDV